MPSTPEIAITASGFGVATQLQHKVIFAPNINTLGAIDCLTPDNKRLRSHVLGLAYTDRSTGQGVMIAEIKDSTGVLVANNQVLYPDAFDSEGGFRADIRYTVTFAGIEQDIILVESPPDPAIYGIQPENCRLEVYSEFVEAPEPERATIVLQREENLQARQGMVEPDLLEETLVFGAMRMHQGVAFRFGETEPTIPMGKTWEQREQRQLLIERLNYAAAKTELDRLPNVAQVRNPRKSVPLRGAGQKAAWASFLPRRPPQAHAAIGKLRPQQMAQANLPRQGFVLDYQLMTAQTNFTFRGDETYFASAQVILSGTTVLEGGAVIKGTNGTGSRRIWIQGPLNCRSSAFLPVIVTGKDDDSVGRIISGSTGQPGTNYYGYLLDFSNNTNAIDLRHVAIRYGYYGINATGGDLTLTDAQIGPSFTAINTHGAESRLRNVLIHEARDYALGGNAVSGYPQGEHVTFHCVNKLRSSGTSYLTNCLLIAVTNNVFYTGSNNETNINDAEIFQNAAYGSRYLANNSPYRNAGTTNIDSTLLVALRQKTTFPPILLTNDINVDSTLTPQAQRDTDAIDLGYHYLPIDWIVGGITVTGATLTVSGGTTIAMDAANTNWGIRLDSGAQLISEGSPINLNRFVRTHSVQEVPAGSGTSTAPLFADTFPAPATAATLDLRFTDVPLIQRHYAFNQPSGQGTLGTIILRDSQFRGGTNCFQPNLADQFMGWTNLLVENAGWFVNSNSATTLHLRNATFKFGVLDLDVASGCTWSVKDCVFDYTTVTNRGAGTLDHDYNGYLTNAMRFASAGANDVVLATNTVNFQTGLLGAYYLPSTSAFIDTGSVTNAGFVGLWHYTTQTDQSKDAGTVLDLGFHYIALNSDSEANDYDGDGLADYLEDANGNGDLDSGETAFDDADTDNDGVNDYIESIQGRNPLIADTLQDTNNVINLRVYTPLR